MELLYINYEFRTVKNLFMLANTSLHLAKDEKNEWLIEHHCTTGIVFIAFTIEAMINHYGRVFDKNWNKNEKSLNRKNAHKTVFNYANLPNYCGTNTYQKANECFLIRDYIAHGKTTDEESILEIETTQSKKTLQKVLSIKPEKYNLISVDNLKKYIEVTEKIQNDIENNGYYPDKVGDINGEKVKLSEIPLTVSGIHEF